MQPNGTAIRPTATHELDEAKEKSRPRYRAGREGIDTGAAGRGSIKNRPVQIITAPTRMSILHSTKITFDG
jgi:hypothetical protein